MKVVLSWLADYVDLTDIGLDELTERWTVAGLEVAGVESIGDWWDTTKLLTAAVVRVEPHPNADRLVLADVDYGAGSLHRVVTGAPNLLALRERGDLQVPMKVAFAREGAELFDGHADGWVKMVLKGRPVRGVMSDAMVCSEKELGLSDDHDGILVLPPETQVGLPLVDVLGDAVVDIDLQANMARAMNMIGVARETAVLLHRQLALPDLTLVETDPATSADVDVLIEAPDLCPRYAARIVSGLSVGPSPAVVARRLKLAGMRPISNLVDVTNYVMLEWGEPLHAFDYDRLVERASGARPGIVIRRAAAGETMTTLDGVQRLLEPSDLLITDAAGPVAIAGVMGGADTEIGPATRRVLLEAAAFDFIAIRRTSRRLKISSESAVRFGRGVHPDLVEPASRRAAGMMAELAGGRVHRGAVDAYPAPPPERPVRLPPGELLRILGVDIPTPTAVDILERLEFTVTVDPDGGILATPPRHRLDVALAADLVEEVARVYGYDRLPETLPADPLPPQRDNPRVELEATCRRALVGAGFQEIISYRFVAPARDAAVNSEATALDHVILANPISPERSALRRSLFTGLLDSASINRRTRERVALFELGPVFAPRPGQLPEEELRLAIVAVGAERETTWHTPATEPLGFFDAKGAVELIARRIGVNLRWRPASHPAMRPDRCAAADAEGITVGHVGEIHPVVADRWGLGTEPVAAADLDLTRLQSLGQPARLFKPIPAYPSVKEDLAVVVDEGVAAADVEAVIRQVAGDLLGDLVLFDVFRGPQIGPGKKSLAWSFRLQARDRTLSGDEAAALRGRIVAVLGQRLGGQLRT